MLVVLLIHAAACSMLNTCMELSSRPPLTVVRRFWSWVVGSARLGWRRDRRSTCLRTLSPVALCAAAARTGQPNLRRRALPALRPVRGRARSAPLASPSPAHSAPSTSLFEVPLFIVVAAGAAA
jgi:hypothetical protein